MENKTYVQGDAQLSEPTATQSIVARELDYKIKSYSHGTYELTQIFPQNGIINPYTITQSGGADTVFQIPIAAYNFAQSYLNFTLQINQTTNATALVNWVYVDGITPIRQLQLYDDNGRFYCDLYDVGNFTNMIFRYTTKCEDLMTSDIVKCGPNATTIYNTSYVYSVGALEGLNPVALEQVNTNVRPTGLNPYGLGAPAAQTTNTNDSIYEPLYMVADTSATNSTFYEPILQWKIPLKKIQGTIFSLDKTLYFGKVLYIRIVWQSSNKVGYYNLGANAVANNPAHLAGSVPTAFTAGYNLSNLYIYLAKETNILVENEIKKKIESPEGFKIMIPWVTQYKQSQNASVNSVTMRITSSLGKRLLKIYWAPYNQTEQLDTAYDHNVGPTDPTGTALANAAPAVQKITSFYTLVNNVRTSQYNYNVMSSNFGIAQQSFNDDYDQRKNKLKGSCIFSRNEYYYNWVWCEDFTDNVPLMEKPLNPDENTYLDGLDITKGEIKYDIFVNQGVVAPANAVPVNYYVYILTLKELTINSAGITLV